MDKLDQNQNKNPKIPEKTTKLYSGKWKKWILIYLLIGAVIYAGVYYFILSKQNSKLYSQPVTKTSQSSSTSQDPTADWKTFANSKYGFSFEYPKQFTIDERDGQQPPNVYSALIYDSSKPKITIEGGPTHPYWYILITKTDKSILDYVNTKPTYLQYENVKIGENNLTRIIEEDRMTKKINNVNFIKKGDYIFLIANSHAAIDNTTFNQILQTFKFTN